MSFLPLELTVQVKKPGEKVENPLTGNLTTLPGQVVEQPVFAWSVVQSVEKTATAATREAGGGAWLLERLEIIGPPGVITNADTVILPDGTQWALQGNAEDHNNNPWWSPGLVIYYAQKVS